MSKKDLLVLVLKIVVAVATAILGVLGISAMSSCTTARSYYESKGNGTIVVTDTTHVSHGGTLKIQIK